MTCRICGAEARSILDLGASPPANSLKVTREQSQRSFPLVLEACDVCKNIQLRDCLDSHDLYQDYFYVTPQSGTLDRHYSYLTDFLRSRGYLADTSTVLEIGSNVGLFLQFLKPHVHRVIGVDPAANICAVANAAGIETVCDFFDARSAAVAVERAGTPSIIMARHCFAHNCTPHEMLAGVKAALPDDGVFVIENAYVLNTIENAEFDQVYHEHMFYYSIRSMQALLAQHGMHVIDVLMSLVHGGSIIFIAKKRVAGDVVAPAVEQYASREDLFLTPSAFAEFARRTGEVKDRLRTLVDELNADGARIYGYGATAKGNTLLNYCGLTSADIPLCVDSTPIKQGKFLPQSNIEVISEEAAMAAPPDYFLLTAWNYKDEIITKTRHAGNYTSKFIIPIPFVHII